MIELDKIEIVIPEFPGFYNTVFEEDYSWQEDFDETFKNKCKPEVYQALYDKMCQGDYFNYKEREADICKAYVDSYNELLAETPLNGLSLEFCEIESPAYYNFTNDNCVCKVNGLTINILNIIVTEMKKHKDLIKNRIKEDFTSRSGFISLVSNDYETWLKVFQLDKKALEKQGNRFENMLAYAISYIIAIYSGENYTENLEYDALDNIYDGSYIDYDKLLQEAGYSWNDIDDNSRQLDLVAYIDEDKRNERKNN